MNLKKKKVFLFLDFNASLHFFTIVNHFTAFERKERLLYGTKHDEFPLALCSSLAARHVESLPNLVNWWIYFMFPSGKGRQNLEGDWLNHLSVILMQSNLICY